MTANVLGLAKELINMKDFSLGIFIAVLICAPLFFIFGCEYGVNITHNQAVKFGLATWEKDEHGSPAFTWKIIKE